MQPHATKFMASSCMYTLLTTYRRLLTCFEVIDVAKALQHMLSDDSTTAETYELYGPEQYSMAQVSEIVDKEIIKHRRHINIHKRILQPIAAILSRTLWWQTLSPDEIEREFIDQEIDQDAKTFDDLGIKPSRIKDHTFEILVSRNSFYFSLTNQM